METKELIAIATRIRDAWRPGDYDDAYMLALHVLAEHAVNDGEQLSPDKAIEIIGGATEMIEIPEPPIDKENRLTAIIRVPVKQDPKHNVADAYCIEKIKGFGGCCIWGYYESRKEWIVNVSARWLVTHLLTLVGELYASEPCRLDHNGNCQEHFYFGRPPCPHKQAKELFQ